MIDESSHARLPQDELSAVPWRLLTDRHFDRKAVRLLEEFRDDEDPEVFRQLFELAGPRLLSLLRLTMVQHRCQEDPMELLTDTFAQVYRARSTFRNQGDGSFTGWFLTIAQNLLRQRHREQSRRDRRESTVARGIVDSSTNPFTCLVREEAAEAARTACDQLRDLVLRAMQSLAPGSRQVLLLHTIHRMKYKDIARSLGITTSAVAMRMKRAREQILRHVARELEASHASREVGP